MKSILVLILASFSFPVFASSNSLCVCRAFPGNFPGAGLFFYETKESEGTRLRLFPTKTPQYPAADIEERMAECFSIAQTLDDLEICRKQNSFR